VANSGLLTKIYFPASSFPARRSTQRPGRLPDQLSLLVGFIFYYKTPLGWNLLLWPVLVVQLMLLALGLGAFFAALNVNIVTLSTRYPFSFSCFYSPRRLSTLQA